jgi:hypothetical protein
LVERIGFCLACLAEGRAEALKFADQHEVDGVTRHAVAGEREAENAPALQDRQAHADDARQNDIGRKRVSDCERHDPRQAVVDEQSPMGDAPFLFEPGARAD